MTGEVEKQEAEKSEVEQDEVKRVKSRGYDLRMHGTSELGCMARLSSEDACGYPTGPCIYVYVLVYT